MATSIGAVERGTTSSSLVSPDVVALVGRILLAAIFVMSGLGKIAQPAVTIGYMQAAGLPLAPVGLAVAALIEVGGDSRSSLATASVYRRACLHCLRLRLRRSSTPPSPTRTK